MKKQELIKHIEDLPYKEGPIVDKIDISRKGLLELVKQLDEPEKVKVPQFVADWYEEHKDNLEYDIWEYVLHWGEQQKSEFYEWMNYASNKPFQTLANMHQFGYEVEKEKRYWVKLKAVDQYLVSAKDEKFLGFLQSKLRSKFTRKELEDLGFGWVFDCEGIEIEEVE